MAHNSPSSSSLSKLTPPPKSAVQSSVDVETLRKASFDWEQLTGKERNRAMRCLAAEHGHYYPPYPVGLHETLRFLSESKTGATSRGKRYPTAALKYRALCLLAVQEPKLALSYYSPVQQAFRRYSSEYITPKLEADSVPQVRPENDLTGVPNIFLNSGWCIISNPRHGKRKNSLEGSDKWIEAPNRFGEGKFKWRELQPDQQDKVMLLVVLGRMGNEFFTEVSLTELVNDLGLSKEGRSYRSVKDTLNRLSFHTKVCINGQEATILQVKRRDERKREKVHIRIHPKMRQFFGWKKSGLLDPKLYFSLRRELTRALYWYAAGQKRGKKTKPVSLNRLKELLGCSHWKMKPRQFRFQLKQALNELVERGVLLNYSIERGCLTFTMISYQKKVLSVN